RPRGRGRGASRPPPGPPGQGPQVGRGPARPRRGRGPPRGGGGGGPGGGRGGGGARASRGGGTGARGGEPGGGPAGWEAWSSRLRLFRGVRRRRRLRLELHAIGAPAHDDAVDLVARERHVDLVAARVIERRAGGRVLLVIEMGERAGRAPRDELVQLALRPAPTRLSVRISPLAPPRATALTAPSIAGSGVRFLDPVRGERVSGHPVHVCSRGGIALRARQSLPERAGLGEDLVR